MRRRHRDPPVAGRPPAAGRHFVAPERARTDGRWLGFRNIAVHDYQALQLPIMVSIIQKHLDEFLQYSQGVLLRDAPAAP